MTHMNRAALATRVIHSGQDPDPAIIEARLPRGRQKRGMIAAATAGIPKAQLGASVACRNFLKDTSQPRHGLAIQRFSRLGIVGRSR